MTFEEFIDSLKNDELKIYKELISRLDGTNENQKAIRSNFAQFAIDVLKSRNIAPDIKFIISGFSQKFITNQTNKSFLTVEQLIAFLPYPISHKTQTLVNDSKRRDAGENVPQFAYDLCSLMGLIIRFNAVITIKSFILHSKGKDHSMNGLISSTIRSPSDGSWLSLLRRLGTKVPQDDALPLISNLMTALSSKRKVPGKSSQTAIQLFENLVNFRNRLIHGDKITVEDINEARDMLFTCLLTLEFFREFDLVVVSGGVTLKLEGMVPEKVDNIKLDIPENEPHLISKSNSELKLSLSPLLYFQGGEKGTIEFDELFFINAGDLENLSYIAYRYAGHMDGQKIGSYEAFQEFVATIPSPPLPENPAFDYTELIQDYTKLFVGREQLLNEIHNFVEKRPTPYGAIKALAGMGKTAIAAHLYKSFSPVEGKAVNKGNRWAFHFTSYHQGRDRPDVALRAIIAQVCDAFNLNRIDWLSKDIDTLKNEKFPELLSFVAGKLLQDERVIIVIDALDEANLSDKESIPSTLPSFVPDGIVFILSYRVDQTNQNKNVQDNLIHLEEQLFTYFANANPLEGLTFNNVQEFMQRITKETKVNSEILKVIWNASTKEQTGADPFYLRFISEGIEEGRIDGNREETIPININDAFDTVWLNLPSDQNFLVQRLLCVLALMFDYADDIFFAEYFNNTGEIGSKILSPSDIAMLRVKAGKLLRYNGDQYALFHDRLKHYLIGQQPNPFSKPH